MNILYIYTTLPYSTRWTCFPLERQSGGQEQLTLQQNSESIKLLIM